MGMPAGPEVLAAQHFCVRCGANLGVPAGFADLHARVHAHLVGFHPGLGLTAAQFPACQPYLDMTGP
jgi:hypothetical protein